MSWGEGDPAARAAVADWLAGRLPARVLADHARRRLVRLDPPGGGPLLVKQFRVASGRHPWREGWKARLGASPADREWRRLGELARAGAPVPEALARGALPGGDRAVVLRWLDGHPLAAALAAPAPARRALLAALGTAVRRLHAAGVEHRDLHAGNVLVCGGRPVLLDVQRARRARSRRARLRDLAWLDHSLAAALSTADRVRLRAAALGLARPFDAEARALLRAVGAGSARRAAGHARSRTRRSLRPGGLAAPAAADGLRGLRVRAFEPAALDAALRGHRAALAARDARVLKDDTRARVTRGSAGGSAVVVKEHPWRGPRRALADLARGSAGRRAWHGGHGLLARGVGAARPLAFLERRRLGLPVASIVVLEDLRPAEPADACERIAPAEVVEACARLALALHRRGADHGDLKASHVFVRAGPRRSEARLVDLEGVRFPRRLSDARRIQALAELNASLPDRFPADARRRAFALHAAALPFAAGRAAALRAIVERSLARRHRWTGAGCALAEAPRAAGPASPPSA
jgi:tRNA A-37 threonylcarbamoyl transferase component Bud32